MYSQLHARPRSCRGCGGPVRRPEHSRCYNCWWALIDALSAVVRTILPHAAELHIGRTCDPHARREEHAAESDRPQLDVLWWSFDLEEICAIEEALIREVAELRRVANASDASIGGGRADRMSCVYVSWRPKTE